MWSRVTSRPRAPFPIDARHQCAFPILIVDISRVLSSPNHNYFIYISAIKRFHHPVNSGRALVALSAFNSRGVS